MGAPAYTHARHMRSYTHARHTAAPAGPTQAVHCLHCMMECRQCTACVGPAGAAVCHCLHCRPCIACTHLSPSLHSCKGWPGWSHPSVTQPRHSQSRCVIMHPRHPSNSNVRPKESERSTKLREGKWRKHACTTHALARGTRAPALPAANLESDN